MKKFFLILVGLIAFIASNSAIPNGEVYKYKPRIERLVSYAGVTARLVPGSLKTNIESIASSNGWGKVIWNAENDYRWVSYTTITRPNLAQVLSAILINYPLQAVFYQGNHVLIIQPRTMR